jgi:hypothetical protein
LLEWNASAHSRQRMETFYADLTTVRSPEAVRRIALAVVEASIIAKGAYTARAVGLHVVYPYCNERLRDWVFHHVPDDRLIGPGGVNKVLMRLHITRRFHDLPYVKTKGCFRFDLRGLARQRFDQVYAFAEQARPLLPGAPRWLEAHRDRLDNKYFASKFYLLAVILPWLLSRMHPATATQNATVDEKVVL